MLPGPCLLYHIYEDAWEPVVLAYFDHQECDLAMYMACIHNDEWDAREANEKAEKFEVNKWIKWEENIIDYIISVYNTMEAPLGYVDRKY